MPSPEIRFIDNDDDDDDETLHTHTRAHRYDEVLELYTHVILYNKCVTNVRTIYIHIIITIFKINQKYYALREN